MKKKYKVIISICLILLFVSGYLNWKYEVLAFHPFQREEKSVLKVMTWNVHCPDGTDSLRQKQIAELILDVDADLVLLNEYYQDSCFVTDSILKARYPFSEECFSHKRCGDIFYSKQGLSNSGQFYIRHLKKFQPAFGGEVYPDSLRGKSPSAVVATVFTGKDSVRIIGMHFMNNSCEGLESLGTVKSLSALKSFYREYKKAQDLRLFQAYWIKEATAETTHPVIVMGDVNDFNYSATMDTLTSGGLKNSWWEGGSGYGSTFHSGWMRLRIDHILHSKELKLESVKVIDTDLSDHNPLMAGFSISK